MESVEPTSDKLQPEMKGWLLKWTSYMKGFELRWFVLSNGALSYYRSQDEVNENCRGTIPLHRAQINTIDGCTFAVSNGDVQTFHIKAASMEELQAWITALNLAKSKVELDYEKEGWLYKYVNMWKGYEQFWFALSDGVLRYYHNRIEKNPNWKTISLHNVQINTVGFCEFSILINGEEMPISFKAKSAEEREAWVIALKSSQAKAFGIEEGEGEAKVFSISKSEKLDFEKEGWLFKHINLWTGYEKRWFVLSNGVLKYCHNRIEKNPAWKTIPLHDAHVNTTSFCGFSILINGQEMPILFKAISSEEREEWVTALKLSQSNFTGAVESGNEVNKTTQEVAPNQDINTAISDLTESLKNLRTCNDINTKNGIALQQALTDLNTSDYQTLTSCAKSINENAKLFRTSSDAMIKACNDYLHIAESQDHNWPKMVHQERIQRQMLEKIVEQLSNQQSQSNSQSSETA